MPCKRKRTSFAARVGAEIKAGSERAEAEILRLVGPMCDAHNAELASIEARLRELEARIARIEGKGA